MWGAGSDAQGGERTEVQVSAEIGAPKSTVIVFLKFLGGARGSLGSAAAIQEQKKNNQHTQ